MKSPNFIILILLVVANTKTMLISTTTTNQESNTNALLSPNPAASPNSIDCSGLISEGCQTKKTKNAHADYTNLRKDANDYIN